MSGNFGLRMESTAERESAVRQNFIQLFNNTSRFSKVLIILSTFGTLSMTAAIIICQVLTPDSCDQPLKLFLWGYMAKLLLNYPFATYLHLNPPTNSAGAAITRTPQQTFILNRISKFKSFLDFIGTAWFMAGNWWFFTSSNCSTQIPPVYWMCVAVLAVNYFIISVITISNY